MSTTGDKFKVFISYSRSDHDFADDLVAVLGWLRFQTFIDRESILGAELVKERLRQLILESDTVVFLASPDSVQNKNCIWEIEEALRRGKRIIPLVCRPLDGHELPAPLRDLAYIYLYPERTQPGTGFGRGLVRLVNALSVAVEWLCRHTLLEVLADRWDVGGRQADALLRGSRLSAGKAWRDKRPANMPELTDLQRAFLAASEEEAGDRIWHTLAALPALAALAAAVWLALAALVGSLIAIGSWTQFFDDAEPPKITLATGPRDLAYWKFGDDYRQALAGHVDVKVEPSNGSPDNKTSLQTGKANAALIQGDTFANASEAKDLESLGALFDDGLWLLHRREPGKGQPASRLAPTEFIDGLRRKKIAIGPDGGGTQKLALSLLRSYRIISEQDCTPGSDCPFLRIDTKDAAEGLQKGTIDAAFFATWFFADTVQKLVQDPDIELWDYPYARNLTNYPPLHTHTLTVGEGFIASGEPPFDITVAATKASLIVRTDLPLTIQYRLLKAIAPIHANPRFQLGDAKFPSPDTPAVPLSVVAQEYYDDPKNPGRFYKLNSFVADRHLPLWIKELIILTLHNLVQVTIGVALLSLLLRLVANLINPRRHRPVAKLRNRVGRL